MMRIAVLDAGSPYVERLVRALEGEGSTEVVARGSDLDTLLELAADMRIDIVLVDAQAVHIPARVRRNVLAYIREVFPSAHVFVVTSAADAEALVGAASRATAVVSEGADPVDVLAAIRNVSSGSVLIGRVYPETAIFRVGPFPSTVASEGSSPLTPRQTEVLELLARGMDVTRISRHLAISTHTTRGHVKDILAKVGAHTQLEAVVKATSMGWLPTSVPFAP